MVIRLPRVCNTIRSGMWLIPKVLEGHVPNVPCFYPTFSSSDIDPWMFFISACGLSLRKDSAHPEASPEDGQVEELEDQCDVEQEERVEALGRFCAALATVSPHHWEEGSDQRCVSRACGLLPGACHVCDTVRRTQPAALCRGGRRVFLSNRAPG